MKDFFQNCHANKLLMACGQVNHQVFKNPISFHVCLIHPSQISSINSGFKHVHTASVYTFSK